MFLRLDGSYSTGKWLWKSAFIYAKANEVAEAGSDAFNHLTNKVFSATEDQSNELGFEVDLGFDYLWNKEITISGNLGYHFTGDYFAYTNSTANSAINSYMFQFVAALRF